MDNIDPMNVWNEAAREVGLAKEISLLGGKDLRKLEEFLKKGESMEGAMRRIMGDSIRKQGQGFVDSAKHNQVQDKIREFAKKQAAEMQAFQQQLQAEMGFTDGPAPGIFGGQA